MDNSSSYFKNDKCRYYPCHKGFGPDDDFNCLFCYCPLNPFPDCPGTPRYVTGKSGKMIKDCSGCSFPHIPENYEKILSFLRNKSN
ncbi:MAG: metal-binding protein [Lachnospiraceae bacterium]|nr:metal-binding protein [Lachnospiraceae bacterium]